MALAPNISVPNLLQISTQPSLTYKFDFETGEIVGMVDGLDAIKQFVEKAILTQRYRYPIYSNAYGCELKDLLSSNPTFELIKSEVPRLITEAIIFDARISNVTNFSFDTSVQGQLTISFTVESVEGAFTANEVIQ